MVRVDDGRYVDYRDSRMKRILGKTSVDLDSRESAVRFGEVRTSHSSVISAREFTSANRRSLVAVPSGELHCRCGCGRAGGNLLGARDGATSGGGCRRRCRHQGWTGWTLPHTLRRWTCLLQAAYNNTLVCITELVRLNAQVLEAGNNVTLGDLFRWSPVEENFEVLEVTGQQLVDFLEKSVKALSLDGTAECASYPHCSFGIQYAFLTLSAILNVSPIGTASISAPKSTEVKSLTFQLFSKLPSFTVNVAAPAGSRVSEVLIHKEPLDLNAKYAIGVSPFVGSGKVIDSINPGTTRLVDHDDGVGVRSLSFSSLSSSPL